MFANALDQLRRDPALPDLPGCASVEQAAAGQCLLDPQSPYAKPLITMKGGRAEAKAKQAALPQIGRKVAVVLGINRYDDKRIPQLLGAVPDAQAISTILREQMGYDVVFLSNPTKAGLFSALNTAVADLKENDSLMVYYAGHGEMVEQTGMGYWIPRDADASDAKGWISNSDLNQLLSRSKSKQMMVVADSCYSGRFTGDVSFDESAVTRIEDLLKNRAVTIMSSGGDEPVADAGKNGHSVFAWSLMQRLGNVQAWESGSNVLKSVRTSVERELPQTPQYGASVVAGHQVGADFVFEKRTLASRNN